MLFELPEALTGDNPEIASLRADSLRVAHALGIASAFCLLSAASGMLRAYIRAKRLAPSPPRSAWFGGNAAVFTLLALFAISALVVIVPVAVPRAVGSLAIFFAFIAVLALSTGLLTGCFDHFRVPAITLLALLAVLFSAFNWSDNHAIRLSEREVTTLPGAGDALGSWINTRKDKDHYGDEPYPVFFVTAAGGGMYAAYQTAITLARLQDRCPNFAQHVFAISAVSGGSLGAAVFSGLAKHYAPNIPHQGCQLGPASPGEMEKRVQRYFLDADFLAPVVAASLFPDFLQRFLPISFNRLDRAQALEKSLAQAWDQAVPEKADDNPFLKPFLSHRDAGQPGPALLLNATDVEHGHRVVISPFEIVSLAEIGNIVEMTRITEFHNSMRKLGKRSSDEFAQDLTLSGAVGLSSRFPWILPAGKLPRDRSDMRIVDGGYIENSGAETVLDLLRTLRSSYFGKGPQQITVHIISIGSLQLVERSTWQGVSEMLSPLRAMMSTRESRGVLAIYHAASFPDDCVAYKICNKARDQFRFFPLNLLDFPIPLGWQLSPISSRLIGLHGGHPDRVNSALGGQIIDDKREDRIFGYVNLANEASCSVLKLLHSLDAVNSCKAAAPDVPQAGRDRP
jgi:hypothetical protein